MPRSGMGRRAGTVWQSCLPGDPDDKHSRYIEAAIDGLLIGPLYLPYGNPAPGPRFEYKLRWLERLTAHTDLDVYASERWRDDALFRPEVRIAYRRLVDQGWIDALRALHPGERIYTFWKCFRNAFGRDAGLRVDHSLLSPSLAGRLTAAGVDRDVRGREKASDHAPTWIELADRKPPEKPAARPRPSARRR